MKYKPSIVLAYFKECGLPEPKLEFPFHPTRKWRFDFAFVGCKGPDEEDEQGYPMCGPCLPNVAVECEGGIWVRGAHGRGTGIKRDMEKGNEAAALGWKVLRVTPDELCTQATVDLIKRCLGI